MLCLVSCILNCIAYAIGWIVLVVTTLKVSLGPSRFQALRDKAFAWYMDFAMKEELKKLLQSTKIEIFSSIKTLKSDDPELLKKNALNILEIGVGTGTNLEFYPAGSRLLSVDPNGEFETYFRRECERQAAHLDPDIRFVVERGESMPSVADSSVDVVVMTLVLCSVTHIDQLFREVRRVLRPGGKFYFLDHVGHAPGTWRRRLQDVLSNSGLWSAIFDGCVLNREYEEVLMNSGFSSVDYHKTMIIDNQVKPASTPPSGLGILNPFAYGEATK